MIIHKEKAKTIAKKWGWKSLPSKGREYAKCHANKGGVLIYTEWLTNDNGIFKYYFNYGRIKII